MASKEEENAGSDNEVEERGTSQKKKPATHDSVGAADLDKVTDYVEEEEFAAQGLEEALKLAKDHQAKEGLSKQEREKALSKVKVRKEDVDLIVNEMEISRQDAERKLRQHMGNVVEALTDLQNTDMPSQNPKDLCNEQGMNASFLLCQRCDSIVLRPGLAKFIEKEHSLPFMRKKSDKDNDATGEMLKHYWHIPTMHTFENVGFTKTVGTLKYLTCADCEVGPIGVHDTTDSSAFYVALDRVRHGNEPPARPSWPF